MPVKLPFRPRRDAYPPDLWTKCPGCSEMLFNKQLDKSLRVCPHCGHHFRISARMPGSSSWWTAARSSSATPI
jgi:acetyl-CoA carboxylase beta subunit